MGDTALQSKLLELGEDFDVIVHAWAKQALQGVHILKSKLTA